MPWLILEDGFLRSVGRHDAPLSMIADDLGVYYDASRPSRVERLIAEAGEDVETERAKAIAAKWTAEGLSKYNDFTAPVPDLPADFVLAVDQTFNDGSVSGGLANEHSFKRMIEAALADHQGCQVVVKVHPDTLAGRRRGYLDADVLAQHPRITVVASHCSPAPLIAGARAVYAVTSQVGFEALMAGKPVRCFGMPFYAGWGLTEDELASPSRRTKATMPQLVDAALIQAPRYVDPVSAALSTPERIMAHIVATRPSIDRSSVVSARGG